MLLNQAAASTPEKIEGPLLGVCPHGRLPAGAMTTAAYALKRGGLDGLEWCDGSSRNRGDHGVIIDESTGDPVVESDACGGNTCRSRDDPNCRIPPVA